MSKLNLSQTASEELQGQRLDKALAILFPDYSRSRLQNWLKAGDILVDGKKWRAKDKINGTEEITINTEISPVADWQPEPIQLDIVFEDDDLLVINKPAGLVVHPGAGNPNGTLLNAIINHAPELNKLARAGIVHRLDKDTTGLMVVAKTDKAITSLVQQLQEHAVSREYIAIARGEMISGKTIETFIDRHPKNRTKMAVAPEGFGKEAITHISVLKKFKNYTMVKAKLETGRTHQIRVHMAHIGFPLVGDQTYAGRLQFAKGTSDTTKEAVKKFQRQALHAKRLQLTHPVTQEEVSWEIDLPADMVTLIDNLEQNYQS